MGRVVDTETRCAIDELRIEMRSGFANVNHRLDTVNGRLRKSEIAIAVLQFGVLTVGGALAYAGMQILVAKLMGQ